MSGLSGTRVLVVEDETLVSMMLEDMLVELGCTIVGPAATVAKALRIAEDPSLSLDAALLDINVAGEEVYPVAEALARRNVPIVFATGYGNAGVGERWRDTPVLQKPYRADEIERLLLSATGKAPEGTPAGD